MKKMNMVEKFGAIKAMLNGEKVEGFTTAEAIEFIEGRIEQVNKKNASGTGERKPTKTQLENETIKEQILSVLEMANKPISITDISKSDGELGKYSNQKLTTLVTQLTKANLVSRTEVKGKAYFALATEE